MHIDIAANLEEALGILDREGTEARPVAGGTDVLLRLAAGKLKAKKLLSIADVAELAFVRTGATHVEIGALTLAAQLTQQADVCRELGCLARAARDFASPQIRNRATVGGNAGNASPAADLVPPLIALGAEAVVQSRRGSRTLPLEDLFAGPGKTTLAPDELITCFRVPRRASAFQAFFKVGSRGANVISIVNAAFCFELAGATLRTARAAFGCCAPTPLRAKRLEGYLTGRAVDAELIRGAAEVLDQELRPIDDVRGSARYKRLLALHATEDALEQVLAAARQAA